MALAESGQFPHARAAGSGRTSIPADQAVPRALYRTAGYRVCGERAVRVDILERLADLIRPALAWREGAAGVKPAAAFNGFGFMVSQAMTSLTCCLIGRCVFSAAGLAAELFTLAGMRSTLE